MEDDVYNVEERDSSLDVYKYRRKSSSRDLFYNPGTLPGRNKYDDGPSGVHFEGDSMHRQKTYAILQETRGDFSNSRLRYAFKIYSHHGWNFLVIVALIVSYILNTWLYSFCKPKERHFSVIMIILCLDAIFAVDVAFLFGLKISKNWRKTMNIVEPETSRVVVDGILALPYAYVYLLKDYNTFNFDFCAVVPLVAMIRDYRIIEYFYKWSSQAGSNQWSTFLLQYLILFILSVHTWTCIWFLFSYRGFDIDKIYSSWSATALVLPTESSFDWYYVCAYWSVMILTTNALGDLYPVTTIERIAAIVAILLGFLLTTMVFVGSLTSQFITMTTRRNKYVRQLKKIQNHLRLIDMDAETSSRIIRYYEDLWYQKSGVFKPQIFKLLPYPLQMEITYDLNAVPLFSSLIFRKLPEAFLRRLSLAMAHQFYLPGDIVYNHGQNKNFMVCITNGVIELLSDEDDESPMISFAKGTCFGEISLVYNMPARCTVKATTYVECQVLEKTDFIKLMITYPELVDEIRKEIHQRVARSSKKKRRQGTHDSFSLNIYASKSRKKSSIKLLKDKLRYVQGKTDVDPQTREDHLDEKCLDLYVLSEHIKKQTTKFTCVNVKFPWILESNCYLVKYWEFFMLALVAYICTVYPYFIGFDREFPGGAFYIVEIVTTIALIFNILLSCTTAIKTKTKYIKTISGIVNFRMNTLGFYLDVLAIIPFEYLVYIHSITGYRDNHRNHLFYLCKGVKLCLVWRVSYFFETLERKLLVNSIVVKVVKYCVYIWLLCYWCGVILYMEACYVKRCNMTSWFGRASAWENEPNQTVTSKIEYPYVTAVYYSTTLIFSIGYGDFYPGDQCDMTLTAFISLYGVLLTGYFVAEFSAVVTHWSRTKTAFLEVIMTIDKFMKENNMNPSIKSRIMSFYELQWQYNSGVELTGEHWLEKTVVPCELRKKVLHQARFKALTSIEFFKVKNKAYIHTLTEMARDIILPPGEIVYYGGTVTRELYVVESGYCMITSNCRETKRAKIIGPGNHLGLFVLLYGVPAVNTVITLTHCKLICIGHAAYTSALSLFPDMKEHDGLLEPDELDMIELQAKEENANVQFHHHACNKFRGVRIQNLLQRFGENSFINVYSHYSKNKESYWQSYNKFRTLSTLSRYVLLPYVVRPDGIFMRTWALLRVATAFAICLFVPIIISLAPTCTSFNVTIFFLDAVCYIDLYLRLHVAYYGPKNQLIYHPYMTASNYLKGAFIIDFLTSFPWFMLWAVFSPSHTEYHTVQDHLRNPHVYHCIFRMANVLQIYRLYAVFWAESINDLKRAYLMSVVQFLLLTIFFLNLYSCILITLTCRYVLAQNKEDLAQKLLELSLSGPFMKAVYHHDGNMICQKNSWIDETSIVKDESLSPGKVYLLALYWVTASFSGAGFGDISAQNTTHMILSICVNVHGVLFFGYVYARIASLKAMADQVTTKFQENLRHLDLFLNREKVPLMLKRTVIDYWKYQWKRTGGWSHQEILGKLHANLNEDAVLYMYEKTLREIPLFEDVEYSFFRAFAKQLWELYFQKGYMVIRSNEVINGMYIIYRGKVDILSDINEVEACMGPGGIFGNIRGATQYKTQSNILASRNIDLLCIDGPAFYALLKSYPSVLRKVKKSVDSTKKDYVLPTVMSERSSFETVRPLTYDSDEDDDVEVMPNYISGSPDKSIAESHGSKSITSASNVDYVPAHCLLFKPHRWFRSSIIPDSKLVTYYEYFILGLSYIDFTLLTYQMAFLSLPYFFYMCVTFDCLFLYKLMLDFHCGYMNRYGDYVLEPKKVRKMFFSKISLRRRDFLANFPVCYMAFAFPVNPLMQMNAFCYMRTPQLFRITYVFTYRTHRKISIGATNLFFKLITIGIWASILSHVNACLFFKLSCLTPDQCVSENWMSKNGLNLNARYALNDYFALYVASLWYMINLLTITGTGDVSAQNDFEVIETIAVMVVIKFCTGLLISEMSAMVSAHASSRISYDYKINKLRDGLRDMQLSEHQTNKMWDYVKELWNRQQGRQMPQLVYKLPFRLRCQMMQAVYGSHILQSIIFSRTEEDFARMVAMWMRHCVFFPGNYIVQCGDADQCIYFIHRGEVEVLTVHPNLTESIYDVLGPEDSFGIAQGLFVGIPHHFSFRARTVVDIVYLKLEQWKYLLDFYPKSAKIVKRQVENVYLAT